MIAGLKDMKTFSENTIYNFMPKETLNLDNSEENYRLPKLRLEIIRNLTRKITLEKNQNGC